MNLNICKKCKNRNDLKVRIEKTDIPNIYDYYIYYDSKYFGELGLGFYACAFFLNKRYNVFEEINPEKVKIGSSEEKCKCLSEQLMSFYNEFRNM